MNGSNLGENGERKNVMFRRRCLGAEEVAAAMNVDSFFGMLPQEAAYETYNIRNILFNDRGDISLTLSPREKAN